MDTHPPMSSPVDAAAQRRFDRRRVLRAFNCSLAAVLLLVAVFACQPLFDWRPWAVTPLDTAGLRGLLTAPLLHGSLQHLAGNGFALLILGTLAGSVYPRATAYSLPLLWLGSGLGAWLLGDLGSRHLGASGISHGLLFLLLTLALLRRDRAAIATGLIAVLFYGGMLLTVLPHASGVSWQSHLGGALAGMIAALLLRLRDPLPPRKRYSWEDEQAAVCSDQHDGLEADSPVTVPVLWHRESDAQRGVLLQFPPGNRERDRPG
jgi:membrane associated rhomboid family serine protease